MARSLTRDRLKERAIQQGLVTRSIGRLQNPIGDEIAEAMVRLGEASLEGGSVLQASREHRQAVERILRASYEAVTSMFARRIEDLIGKAMKNEARERRIREWIARVLGTRAALVSQQTVDDALEIVNSGLREGESIRQIAERLRDVAPGIAAARAIRIARTEVHAAAQAGQYESAKASGLRMEKEWVSSQDSRVRDDRFSHRAVDGERVGIDQMFQQTGEPLEYPGDFRGSAGNVINCRCATVYHVTE